MVIVWRAVTCECTAAPETEDSDKSDVEITVCLQELGSYVSEGVLFPP